MPVEEKFTYCRLCEQLCGLSVTIEDGVATKVRADREHPVTHGFACPKGQSINEITYDPDRVLHPLRRNDRGEFEAVSWDTAFAEIGRRLRDVSSRHGSESIGVYAGNPAVFNFGHAPWAKGMMDAMESHHFYSSGSQDANSRFAASHFLYGNAVAVPIPDIPRTDFLLIVGANPLISHGSLVAGGLIRTDLFDIVERGGRVVVVDPRRTETAERFEHVPVVPDGDAWLLMAMLNVIFSEGLVAPSRMPATTGLSELRAAVQFVTPEAAETHSGVPADTVRALARDLAGADSAAVYGRVGACVGKYGTVVNFLLDAINVVTGNLDRPGGAVFAAPPIDLLGPAARSGMAGYGTKRSRIGNYPDVIGMMPAGLMAEEITTPGPGQLRALIVTAGNPVLSTPNGRALKDAFEQLDLLVSIDLYMNESSSAADYILPATTFLEREDVNTFVQPFQYKAFVQWTDAVLPARGEARDEWTIFRDICREIGVVPSSVAAVRKLGRLAHYLVTPRRLMDAVLRMGPFGDRFGLRRGGLSRRHLLANPHGIMLTEAVATGVLDKFIMHAHGRVELGPKPILDEILNVIAEVDTASDFPLRLFGRRELRSLNSWMHNSPRLNPRMKSPTLLMNAADALRFGIADGDDVVIESATGAAEAPMKLSDSIIEGSVCLPHGWGHGGDGGWQRANATGGSNVNALTASGVGTLEPLAAMSILNGVRVRVRACEPAAASAP